MFVYTKTTIINMAHVATVKDDSGAQQKRTRFTFLDGSDLTLHGSISQLMVALYGDQRTLAWDPKR